MSTVEVFVYGADGATLITGTPVDRVLAASCIDELDATGGGSITVALSSEVLAANSTLLDYRNVVKLRVAGTIRGAFVIKKRSEVIVGDGADASRAITVSGPGLLDWLRDAIVYPESPSPFSKSVRHFNFGSKRSDWFTLSEWGFATRVRQRGGTDLVDRSNPWANRPVNWPACNPLAWWIWDRDSDTSAPVGFCYFRRGFTTTTAGTRYRLYFAADNQCSVMVDGEALAAIPATADSFGRTWYVDFTCDAGDHVTGWKVRNLSGPAGLLAVLFEVSTGTDNREVLTQVWHTGDGSWRVRSYPSTEPGWTIGAILSALSGEATARGVPTVARLTPTWTLTQDSEGVTWPRVPWQTGVGTNLLDAFTELQDFGLDLWANPDTLAFNAYVSRGASNLDVMIDAGSHIQDLTEEVEAAITNVLLVATGDQWAGASDPTSRTTYGRIEGYIDLSRFTAEQAIQVSQAILDRAKIPTEGAEVTYVPTVGNTPWVDFGVGDTVSVSTAVGYRPRIVSSISVAMDEAGLPVYTVELDTIFRDLLAKLQRIINQAGLANGTVPGQAGSPGNSPSGGGGGPGGGSPPGGGGGTGPYVPPTWNGGNYQPDANWPGGGDSGWSADPYLQGPGWNPGDPYGTNTPGFYGGGATPALTPPGESPWLPPTDPGGGSGTLDPTPPGNGTGGSTTPDTAAVAAIGRVSANLATAMHAEWGTAGTLYLALTTDAPTVTDGVIDISGVEMTAPGYSRRVLLPSEWGATTGAAPVIATNVAFLKFTLNTDTEDWPPIVGVALIAADETTVLGWSGIAHPVVIPPTKPAWFPLGYLALEVWSA